MKIMEMGTFVVRPKGAKDELKDLLRIHLSKTSMYTLGLRPGDVCRVVTPDDVAGFAIVKDNANIKDSIVQTSKAFQSCMA